MSSSQIFPSALICLSAGASIVYAFSGNWRLAVYWACAAILNTVITF